MISARRYRPTNTRFFTWLLRHTYAAYIASAYRARGLGLDIFKTLKPPFILVGNHSTLLDPFLTNYFVPHPIHWVASDGNMRNPLMRFLLIKLVGSIPKSKVIPDIETVNWIVEFIRKKKGVVGFYPEGQSTWDGASMPAFGSTAKLIKLLKAPVICAVSRGAYMTKPRWAYTRREGGMEIEFKTLFTPQALKSMSVEEIDAALNSAIAHNDPSWARAKGLRFRHPRRAECLELALFACPACGALHTMSSRNELISCSTCGFSAEYGEDGSFRLKEAGDSPLPLYDTFSLGAKEIIFLSIQEWDRWQRSHLHSLIVKDFTLAPGRPLFSDEGVKLLRGKRMDTMRSMGSGKLTLSADSLTLWPEKGRPIAFDLQEIEGPGVLKWNFLEFYVGMTVYRARFSDKKASGYKYATALEQLIALRRGS